MDSTIRYSKSESSDKLLVSKTRCRTPPAAEAPKDAVPLPENFRQVTPGRTGADSPEHAFHQYAVLSPYRTALVRTADDQA